MEDTKEETKEEVADDNDATVVEEQDTVGIHPPSSANWDKLLENLQTTIEESQRIREKYYDSPGKIPSTR